jgi:hypothetical protein
MKIITKNNATKLPSELALNFHKIELNAKQTPYCSQSPGQRRREG